MFIIGLIETELNLIKFPLALYNEIGQYYLLSQFRLICVQLTPVMNQPSQWIDDRSSSCTTNAHWRLAVYCYRSPISAPSKFINFWSIFPSQKSLGQLCIFFSFYRFLIKLPENLDNLKGSCKINLMQHSEYPQNLG